MTAPFPAVKNLVTSRFAPARTEGGETQCPRPAPLEAGVERTEGRAEVGGCGNPSAEYLEAAIRLGYRPLPSRRVVLTDAYFDTATFDLLRSGIALRLRGSAAGMQVTLKSLDRPGFDDLAAQRLEIGGPIEDALRPLDCTSWPEAVRDRVRAAAGEAPKLLPISVLIQRRENVPLAFGKDGEGRVVAEIGLDVVDVLDPHDAGGEGSIDGITRLLEDGAPVATFSELELEPASTGAPAALHDLTEWLRAMPDLAPDAGSKLEQALCALADHPPGSAPGVLGIRPEMPMAEAGRLMWRRQLVAMLLSEAGARRGLDIEYVHDMRVATRRARAVARLFGPFFRRRALGSHLEGLRRTARMLGAVRDADVALLKLRKHARSRPEEEQQGLAEIRAVWRVERRHAYRSLLAWLDSADYRGFLAGFSELSRTPGLGARPAGAGPDRGPARSLVRDAMPSAILGRFEQVRAYGPLFEGTEPVSIPALHALRIDCKALRYSLEPVEHLLGEEGGELIRSLKRLQDLLGDLNDAAVADGRLADLADVVEPTALAAYRAHQQATVADLAAAAPEAWRSFVAPDNRRLLALAIARL